MHTYASLSLNNIGLLLMKQNNFKRALTCFEEAFAMSEKILSQHKSTAVCLFNIALAWQKLGELDKSLEHHEKCLRIR